MTGKSRTTRRQLLKTAVLAPVVVGCGTRVLAAADDDTASGQQIPLKIGIRAASMRMVGDINVVKTAASIPGIMGVELQTTTGRVNLRDWDAVRRYKQEADRWAMHIPSLAGVWDRGVNIRNAAAGESLVRTIRAAEMLGSGVILLAFFKQNAPDMTREESYGPVVDLLQKTANVAANAGVVMGLENSLSPADNVKLIDLVDHSSVRVYYDLHNMAHYGHQAQAIPGVKLLGKQRICMVHVKNGSRLLREPGPIDWIAAFRELNDIGYDGWYIYETSHDSTADCIDDTSKNNLFLQQHVRMPRV
jgi:sugar phosphate isomerase/epimerase